MTSAGPERCARLERLALQPLQRAVLEVADADVVAAPSSRRSRRRASASETWRAGAPMTTASSASQSTSVDDPRQHDVVVRADQRRRVLREQRRVLGELAPHLEDVVAVVEPDADDLARGAGRAARSRAPSRSWRAPGCAHRRGRASRGRRAASPTSACADLDRVRRRRRARRRGRCPSRIVASLIAAPLARCGRGASASYTGASPKANRSRSVPAVIRSRHQDGTATRSPWPTSNALVVDVDDASPGTPARPTIRRVRVGVGAAPARSRCISMRIVGSASPPVAGLVNRTAAWPGLDDARVAVGLELELRGERRVGVGPAVGHERRARAAGCHQRAERRGGPRAARRATTDGVEPSASVVGSELEEAAVEVGDERHVEPVEPHHRCDRRCCGARARPSPAVSSRSPATHRDRVAVDDGPDAFAVEDESERVLAVAVSRARPRAGPRYWTAAHSVGVANGAPPRPGFASAIARRSPPRPTGRAHRRCSASGSTSAQRHTCGRAAGVGAIGMRSSRCVHSGARPAAAKSA